MSINSLVVVILPSRPGKELRALCLCVGASSAQTPNRGQAN